MHSCLYEGQVRHRRFAPTRHTFNYRVFYVYLDLDELGQVFKRRWFWSTRGFNLAWLKRGDYIGPKNISIKQAVMQRIKKATGTAPEGPIRMLTHLRYFGIVFNPVTFYYCFDKDDTRLETIVAEITNTPWGEHYAYVLPIHDAQQSDRHLRFGMHKDFHVSPFMPMDIDYQWYFRLPDDKLNVHMVNHHQGDKIFDATLQMHRKALTARNCSSVLLRYPLITLTVISAIYWQAMRLFLKRTPFYSHPLKTET